MNVRFSILLLLSFVSCGSAASAMTYREQADAMLLCYQTAATGFALRTCEPASVVIEATFGKCEEHEEAVKNAIVAAGNVRKVAETTIQMVRERSRPKLLSTVLESRAQQQACR